MTREDADALAGYRDARAVAVRAYCSRLCPPDEVDEAVEAALARLHEGDLDAILLEATRIAAAEHAAASTPADGSEAAEPSGLGALIARARRTPTCEVMPRLLAARASGTLSAGNRERMARHLERCSVRQATELRFVEAEHAFGVRRQAAPVIAGGTVLPPEVAVPPEPEAAEPETAEPVAAEPEAAERETAEPEAVEQQAVEAEPAEPEAVEPAAEAAPAEAGTGPLPDRQETESVEAPVGQDTGEARGEDPVEVTAVHGAAAAGPGDSPTVPPGVLTSGSASPGAPFISGSARRGMRFIRRPIVGLAAALVVLAAGVVGGYLALSGDSAEERTRESANPPAGATERPERPERPPIKPESVTVSVLNGASVELLAARTSDRLEEAGFEVGTLADAAQPVSESEVRYAGGAGRKARLVARRLDIPEVRSLDPENQSIAGDARVVVIAGPDLEQ